MALNKPQDNGLQNFLMLSFFFGFSQSKSDYSLFTKGSRSSFVALLVYVDDIIITGPSSTILESLKQFLHSQFKLKDIGSLKFFLGIETA